MKKPLILITNDDGIFAPGIKALVEVAQTYGDVIVVAPNSPQSGQGHSITIEQPIRLHKVSVFEGVDAYECSGTPVDCVKMAKHAVLKDRKIDLCLSGINHGLNTSVSILYSGTMSAAMEASIEGIPSIGFSHGSYNFDTDYSLIKGYIIKIIEYFMKKSFTSCRLLNVNIPNIAADEIKGIKVCKQGDGLWKEKFLENKDPQDRTYYWLTGYFEDRSVDDLSDIWAVKNGYISVVPVQHDLTDYNSLEELKDISKIFKRRGL